MNSDGHWSSVDRNRMAELSRDPERSNDLPRYVFSVDIGATVELTRGNDRILAVFEGAEKNKVTVQPIEEEGKPLPYIETGETVYLSNGTDAPVKAQMWDRRTGKFVLRTLPI